MVRLQINKDTNERKLTIFGDSIAAGLGARQKSYSQIVAEELGMKLVSYAVSGYTVRESLRDYLSKPEPTDFAVIAHGVTEPILRPNPRSLVLLPSRWKKLGWMDPRAYYSTRLSRRSLEKIESGLRWRVKNFLIRIYGSSQLLSEEEYVSTINILYKLLIDNGAKVIVLGPPPIDERYFPGSSKKQSEYLHALEQSGVPVLKIGGELDTWEDFLLDHFHPNASGHLKMAKLLIGKL